MRVHLPRDALERFMTGHDLPPAFGATVAPVFDTVAQRVAGWRRTGQTLLLGIGGGQGSGKSTLADYLALVLQDSAQWRVAVASIDDFYLTREARRQLALAVHPLLATRGVPGTHDTRLLDAFLDAATTLADGASLSIPAFDKALDDRRPPAQWPRVTGPLDLVILEGWCVGVGPEPAERLRRPVNELERQADADGRWRDYVNRQLDGPYRALFDRLDRLVYLQVPDFDAVVRWRGLQEDKLVARRGRDGPGVMSREQVAGFARLFERLTGWGRATLPQAADLTLVLDEAHGVRIAGCGD